MTGMTESPPESSACPCCGAISHNPNDVKMGYCARCHWFTGDPLLGPPHLADPCPHRTDNAVTLLREALFLRQNGERPPGGSETWHDWDRRAERFLRGLLPPEGDAPRG